MARNSSTVLKVPAGKLVKIFAGRPNNENKDPIEAILTDDFTFSIGGEYTTVVNNNTSTVLSMLSSILGNFKSLDNVAGVVSGLNSKLAYQVYTSGKPISFSLNCQVVAVTNAYEEVVKKIRDLQIMMSPEEDSNGFLKRLPGIGLIEQLGEYTVGVKDNSKWGYIRIGRLSFYDVLFKTMSVTYSPETDQTDYPVMAKFTLDVETSQMVTERIINELYSVSSDGNDIFEDMDEAWEYYNT